ncbi:hypothetical protein B2I22_16915 [Bacillus spizizenii]|nr:hypothetical protein B2I22_16915 [Bacillus spizizenii]
MYIILMGTEVKKMSKHILFIEASTTGAGAKANDYAKSKGYTVSLAVRNPNQYSDDILNTADNIIVCNTNDYEELINNVLSLNQEKQIDGITTTADFYVPQAALAAETLKLPGISFQAALNVRNKYKMRKKLSECYPHLNPAFQLVKTKHEALKIANEWGYPIIAKPQDLNDSLHVKLIGSEKELLNYMEHSTTWMVNESGQPIAAGVLLEGYINGGEYSVETMQHKGGEIQLIGITKNVLEGVERGHFAEVAASFPSDDEETKPLLDEVKKALQCLEIDCGVIHTECRIENGNVKIIEINPRLIGDKVGSHVIELAYGISPLKYVVEIALGSNVEWRPNFKKAGALYGLWVKERGVFGGIENPEEILRRKGVAFLEITGEIGSVYSPPTSNGDIVGHIITQANSPEEALKQAYDAAQVAKLIVNHE